MGSLERAFWSSGSFGYASVHSGAIAVVRFIRVRRGSLGRSIVPGSFGFAWLQSAAPRDHRVNKGSSWSTTALPWVVGFILDCVISLGHTKWSSGSAGLQDHSSWHEFTPERQAVVAFFRVCVDSLGRAEVASRSF